MGRTRENNQRFRILLRFSGANGTSFEQTPLSELPEMRQIKHREDKPAGRLVDRRRLLLKFVCATRNSHRRSHICAAPLKIWNINLALSIHVVPRARIAI